MNTTKRHEPLPNATPIVTALLWAARLASLASFGLLLLFIFGDAFNPVRLRASELLLSLFFPFGVMVGMVLAWRWPIAGGTLTLASLAAFYGIHLVLSDRFPRGWAFLIFALPGLLFLAARLARPRRCCTIS